MISARSIEARSTDRIFRCELIVKVDNLRPSAGWSNISLEDAAAKAGSRLPHHTRAGLKHGEVCAVRKLHRRRPGSRRWAQTGKKCERVGLVWHSLTVQYPGSPEYPGDAAWKELGTQVGNRLHVCSGSSNRACGSGNLRSEYVVAATNAQDVSAALKFATRNKIRVTIRNTGHDFLARYFN
jgi:hypothetical protein